MKDSLGNNIEQPKQGPAHTLLWGLRRSQAAYVVPPRIWRRSRDSYGLLRAIECHLGWSERGSQHPLNQVKLLKKDTHKQLFLPFILPSRSLSSLFREAEDSAILMMTLSILPISFDIFCLILFLRWFLFSFLCLFSRMSYSKRPILSRRHSNRLRSI